jgi:hypothetical protein
VRREKGEWQEMNPKELHVCCGLNACSGHGKSGTNACAGQGDCATVVAHSCAGTNECRGQGGCGFGSAPGQQDSPGVNECKGLGGCGSPIGYGNDPNVKDTGPPSFTWNSTAGVNNGNSVWAYARFKLLERMDRAGITVTQPSPCSPPSKNFSVTVD